ncbi:hypothetical protein FRB95_012849 [Tulasnella sp. JGI-2019a]|nr:hypothetical protein FRB95_012849 [Tulasnella sp. JGI-2019a]
MLELRSLPFTTSTSFPSLPHTQMSASRRSHNPNRTSTTTIAGALRPSPNSSRPALNQEQRHYESMNNRLLDQSPYGSPRSGLSSDAGSSPMSLASAPSPASSGQRSPSSAPPQRFHSPTSGITRRLITFNDFELARERATLTDLIIAALEECPDHRANSRQICAIIRNRYPERYGDEDAFRKLSEGVKQRLTNRLCFEKLKERPSMGGGGCYWIYDSSKPSGEPSSRRDQRSHHTADRIDAENEAPGIDTRGVVPTSNAINIPRRDATIGYGTNRGPSNLPTSPMSPTSPSSMTPPFVPPPQFYPHGPGLDHAFYPSSSQGPQNLQIASSASVFHRMSPPKSHAMPTTTGWRTYGQDLSFVPASSQGQNVPLLPLMPSAMAPALEDAAQWGSQPQFDWCNAQPEDDNSGNVYQAGVHNFAGYGLPPTWSE